MMSVRRPLGTVSRTSAEAHQFIRDPNGVIDPKFRDDLATAIALPLMLETPDTATVTLNSGSRQQIQARRTYA